MDALRLRLESAAAVVTERSVGNMQAYELYLRGRQIFTTSTNRASTNAALRYFEQAMQLDSTLAQAHAGISDVHARLAVFGFVPARAGFARAKAAALRALALDSTLADAHASLGHALCVADFEWKPGLRALEKAVTLDPSYTFARMPYAICLMSLGRFRDAEKQLETARKFDPLSPAVSNMFGRLYVNWRRPDKAITNLEQALELSPDMDLAYQELGHAYLQKGNAAEAISAFRRAAALSGPRDSLHLAYAYGVTGQRAEAARILASVLKTTNRNPSLAVHIAMAHTGLGEYEQALDWLELGYRDRVSFMVGMNVEPAFAPLHDNPRFKALQQRMRL